MLYPSAFPEAFASSNLSHPPLHQHALRFACLELLLAEDGVPGSRGLLPAPSPLGTVHAAFAAHGSSISKGNPCEAARLCYFLVIPLEVTRFTASSLA
jgi:hypothetical protein